MRIRVLYFLGHRRAKRMQIARMVSRCFNDVDWTKQQFIHNGSITMAGDEDKFYKAGEVDKAISKLNKMLTRLNK